MNSKLDWNNNLAAIFEAKLAINRLSSSVLFNCICHFSGNVTRFYVFLKFDLRSNIMVYELIT